MDKDYCWFSEFWVDANYRPDGQGNPLFEPNRNSPNFNAELKMLAMKQQIQRLVDTERTNQIFQL